MKALVQRVSQAHVEVLAKTVSQIKTGMLVFLGVEKGDTDVDLDYLVKKLSSLRIFEDSEGKMNLSIQDIKGEALVVSQFTLAADVRKGTRPSFDSAEEPTKAKEMYERFIEGLRTIGIKVASGEFGASMQVHLVNDGPVTIILESKSSK